MEISKKKLLKKMILNMSVILLVSTATLCFITLRYFSNIYKEEVNKYNSKLLSQVQKIIDMNLIREVEGLQSDIISLLMFDEDFKKFVDTPSVSSVTISNMYKKIRDMKNNNSLIQEISIYSYSSNTIMSSAGVKFLNDSKNALLVNVPWKKHIEKVNNTKSWVECRFDMSSPYNAEPENIIYFLASYPMTTSTRYRKAIISIGIKESSIFDNMVKIISEEFGQMLVIDGNGRIMSHADKELIGTKPEDMLFLNKIQYQDEAGFWIDSYNGRQVAINFKASDYYDWKYIVVDDYDVFYNRSRVIRIFTLFMYGIVLLFGAILIILSSRNLYKPFTSLVQYANEVLNKISTPDVSIDAMDEINIIDKAFEQMSHNIESLQEFVQSKKDILRRAYFNGLISEENDFANISPKNMIQLGVHFFYKNFALMMLDIISVHEGRKSGKYIEGSSIIGFIEGKLLEKSIISYGFTTYKNDIVIIVNYDKCDDFNLFEICEQLKEDIEKSFEVNISIGISGNTDDVNNINILYKQAMDALSYKFMHRNASIFSYDELVGQRVLKEQVGFKLEYVSSLLDLIKLRHKDKVKETIQLIIEHLFNDGHSIEFIKEYIVFIASDLTKLAYDLGYSEQQVFGVNLIQDFIDIGNMYELEHKLEHYCYRFVEFLENEKKEKNLNLVRNAIQYMRENMANDLSLITVADFVGVGPSFLSKIFKEETGIKFVDYCINLKLEYAQKLLEEGNSQIEEISQKVGYSQTQYFIKKFKEKYGITPKQYQMKFLHGSTTLDK